MSTRKTNLRFDPQAPIVVGGVGRFGAESPNLFGRLFEKKLLVGAPRIEEKPFPEKRTRKSQNRPRMGSGNEAKAQETLTKWKTTKPKGAAREARRPLGAAPKAPPCCLPFGKDFLCFCIIFGARSGSGNNFFTRAEKISLLSSIW